MTHKINLLIKQIKSTLKMFFKKKIKHFLLHNKNKLSSNIVILIFY